MKSSFNIFVAARYLFSKHKLSTINLITWVSAIGVAVGTMAIIIVLSVLNGFEQMIERSFSAFDPELKILPAQGKSIDRSDSALVITKESGGYVVWSEVIEQHGLLSNEGYQLPVLVRGVESNYPNISKLDSLVWNGRIELDRTFDGHPFGIMGLNLASKMRASVNSEEPICLYAPRNRKVNLLRADANFRQLPFYVSALFFVQQEKYDNNLVILPIEAVRTAYEFNDNYINFVEVRISKIGQKPDYKHIERQKKELQKALGQDYIILNRHEQQADFFRISNIEKWTTFLILAFILMIATFNIIGSLSMIIIDKKEDIRLFLSIGATERNLRELFFTEGMLIGALGCAIGLIMGVIIVLLQQQFGFVHFNSGFLVQVYPVKLELIDVITTTLVVLSLCSLSTFYTTKVGLKKVQFRHED